MNKIKHEKSVKACGVVCAVGKDLAECGGVLVDGDFVDGNLVLDVASGHLVYGDAVDDFIQMPGCHEKKVSPALQRMPNHSKQRQQGGTFCLFCFNDQM